MITTALVIILGLADGRPVQVIHREWPTREFVWAGAQAECDAAKEDVATLLAEIRRKNPQFLVSVQCGVERKS